MVENSQESNKSMKSLVNISVENVSNSSRRDSIDLFVECNGVNVEKQEEVKNKDYKRESLDLFEGSFEQSKFTITVNVTHGSNPDNFSNKSVSDSYFGELINIKTPKEPEEKWDCNIGGESILEMTQRDFGTRKRKREDESAVEKHTLLNNFLEPQPKYKKTEESISSNNKATESNDMFEGTMFPGSLIVDTQLDKLLNSNGKSNATLKMISEEMSDSVMKLAFQNSFNLLTNTIICPNNSNAADIPCKDLVISDSEDMIAGSQDTMSSGPSPHKYVLVLLIHLYILMCAFSMCFIIKCLFLNLENLL